MTLSPEALEQLRALLAKATPGPWHMHTNCPAECCWHLFSSDDGIYGAEVGDVPGSLINHPEMSEDNARLITEAINILPALLSDYERLRTVEAAVMAAPSVAITACNQIPGARDLDYGDMSAAVQAFLVGQTVRLVIVPEGEV